MSSQPEIAVVVLSVRAPPELALAVDALLAQTIKSEIVVVNTGGGDAATILPRNVPNLRIVSIPQLLWPGAARNVGIKATTAPWIAFIASDQIALRNWLEVKLDLHKRGHTSVAGCVINSHPRNIFAWATHISVLVRRLPHTPRKHAIQYGGSHARELFERYGYYREDLRIGEDTEFQRRLSKRDRPARATGAQSIHLNPTTFRAMARDMYDRGQRYGYYWNARHKRLLKRIFTRFMIVFPLGTRSVRGMDRVFVWAALPLILLCNVLYELGVSEGRRRRIEHPPIAPETIRD